MNVIKYRRCRNKYPIWRKPSYQSFFSVVQMSLVLHFCCYFCYTLYRTMMFSQAWHRQKVERIHYTISLQYLVMFGRCCYLPIITRLEYNKTMTLFIFSKSTLLGSMGVKFSINCKYACSACNQFRLCKTHESVLLRQSRDQWTEQVIYIFAVVNDCGWKDKSCTQLTVSWRNRSFPCSENKY